MSWAESFSFGQASLTSWGIILWFLHARTHARRGRASTGRYMCYLSPSLSSGTCRLPVAPARWLGPEQLLKAGRFYRGGSDEQRRSGWDWTCTCRAAAEWGVRVKESRLKSPCRARTYANNSSDALLHTSELVYGNFMYFKQLLDPHSRDDSFPPAMKGGASALATLPTGGSTSGGWASG